RMAEGIEDRRTRCAAGLFRRRWQRREKRLGQSGARDRRGAQSRRENLRHRRKRRRLHEESGRCVRGDPDRVGGAHYTAHRGTVRSCVAPSCEPSGIEGNADEVGVGAIDSTPLERITAAAVIGAALWLGVNWILALTHTLTRATLLCASVILVITAVVLLWRRFRLPKPDWFAVIVCIPIALWIVFVLWRGVVLPPDNHDALAYHFPKAVFIAQAH